MENLFTLLDPIFIAAILSLTEVLKRFLPKANPRLLTVITTVAIGVAVYFGKDISFVETLVVAIASLLTSSGLYSLVFKPVKQMK